MTNTETVSLYFRMSRPTHLLLIAAVYSWGVLVALVLTGDRFQPVSVLFSLIPLLSVSASVHYANEYADHETDALTDRTPFSGGSGALKDHGAEPDSALMAGWIALIAGTLSALLLAAFEILPATALLVLTLGAFGGWMYSLPPLALAWRGWGEITNAFLGGVLLPILGFVVVTGQVRPEIVLLALPFGLIVFDNLLATTWPDRSADLRVGKLTLAAQWPVKRLRWLYLAAASASILFLVILQGRLLPELIFFMTLLIVPALIWAWHAYTRQRSPFPTVFVMLLFLGIQIVGWSAALAFPDAIYVPV